MLVTARLLPFPHLTSVFCALALAIAAEGGAEPETAPTAPVDFNRQVRPIFAENCLTCHGPDEKARKGKLRLDVPEEIVKRVVAPGQSGKSLLIERVASEDAEFRMPPAKTGKRLTAEQVKVLRRWIDQGAKWSTHWAYTKPQRPPLPPLGKGGSEGGWPRNAIDHFILARLEKEKLRPSPEADRTTLIRRLTLDLTGLPPTPEAVDAFLADSSPDAYGRLVERVLASPNFGERMAQHWLDLARFGDSDGYHDDTPRVMYQFRDYVIDSFNHDKPFDQFTLEQIAGDLLPEPSAPYEGGAWGGLEHKIGSAFHRLGPTSSEGGADAKEYLAKYAVDRVNTTAAVWLGVTLHCAECHDHKYDPFTTREYYQLFAFFNQVPEDALYRGNDAPPVIPTPNREQQRLLDELSREIARLDAEIKRRVEQPDAELDSGQKAWEQKLAAGQTETFKLSDWHAIGPFPARDGQLPPFDFVYPPEKEVDLKQAYGEGRLQWKERPEWKDGKPYYLRGENCATYLYRTIHADARQALTLYLGSDDGIKLWVNGKQVLANILVRGVAPNQEKVSVVLEPGENRILMKIVNLQGGYGFYFHTRAKETDEELEQVQKIVQTPREQRDATQQAALRRFYRERYAPALSELRVKRAEASQQKSILEQSIPRLRIMADAPQRRPTHILLRGDFRKLGDEVQPRTPAVLHPLHVRDGRAFANRLDLARWIVDRDNPLTARVVVNRLWQLLFGQGLVRTVEDLGVRGEPPSHPELLDWLACEFVDSGWNVKHLLRLMVTSATYRQSSRVSPELRERDPNNALLARGPRFRLPAEMIRDNALAISGLLDRRIGGPSVKPYQPGDLWREMSYGDSADKAYIQDHGLNLYRRGLYTFWKRSVMYPAFAVFDAPNREVCVAGRPVTNTPLQAFVTLNDVTYVEAARVFAERVLREGGASFEDRLTFAFRRALARPPTAKELAILKQSHDRLHDKYRRDPDAARALTSAGEYPIAKDLDVAEHAAWTGLCQVILNLDETLTRE
jgi:mono/diheme cytochrome c family protein